MNTRPKPTIAFVFGGGGRWGAVEVGMLEALVDSQIMPHFIVGTSIGAMNGAVFAAEPNALGLERLRTLWKQVADKGFGGSVRTRLRNLAGLRSAIYPVKPIRDLLEESLDVSRIEDLAVPFSCVASSIERAAERWFSAGSLIEALLASSAIPGIFPPVEIDGEHYYDGGLVNSVPVDRAVAKGATEIYVLQVGRLEYPLEPPKRIHESALIAFEIARRHRFGTLREGLPDGVTMHLLPSGKPLAYKDPRQLRWSDLGDTTDLINAARDATAAYLAGTAGSS